MSNTIQLALKAGQAIWLDYVRRGLIKSGEFEKLVQLGVSGLTANPTILEKAITGSTDYDRALAGLAGSARNAADIYETLAVEDIQAAADLLRPTYDRTNGEHGYACLEIAPLVAYDTDKTVSEGRRLFTRLDRPNVMVKVPATEEGIPAIRQLTAEGVKVNVTLIFSLDMYRKVRKAYISGVEDYAGRGGDPSGTASVASFFLSRIDTATDNLLEELIRKGQKHLILLLGRAAVASAKLAYKEFEEDFYGKPFEAMRKRNARVQRPLWASTGTKNPAYTDLKYVESLIGPDTVNTLPLATIRAFLDHGRVAPTIEDGIGEAKRTFASLQEAGISIKEVSDRLLADGVKAFSDSYDKLISSIEEKRKALSAAGAGPADLEAATTELQKSSGLVNAQEIARRIWQKDHTLWKPDPAEITDRLGWLTVTDQMRAMAPGLQKFGEEIRDEGYKRVVLLGMGGSSLGAEVIRQISGKAAGFPELTVLDSTVPEAVQAVATGLDLRRTFFLVSSKSGTTTEPLMLFRYFKGLVSKEVGEKKAGRNFAAITDPGTPLVELSEKEGFRRVFLNPADIGGRYSVLSLFGLVPAALSGTDLETVLDQADRAREACAACVPALENPGLMLGELLGTAARVGRDKLTLITSPHLSSFGLWIEQLIAESTGKEGKGILPVAGEPAVDPASYGNDRLFIYIRLSGDDNAKTDRLAKRLESANIPVTTRMLREVNGLWAEFYIWEFATAAAGAILGVNPFDQPDVQKAKDATQRLLKAYRESGRLPAYAGVLSVPELLMKAEKGKYLAILAYVRQTPEADKIFNGFRKQAAAKYGIATTLGYGPRYLHSTGQLHKGGPDEGLFIQVTADHGADLPVPGEPYSLAVVADAEAAGDLEALQNLGRPVALVHCPAEEKAVYETLRREFEIGGEAKR